MPRRGDKRRRDIADALICDDREKIRIDPQMLAFSMLDPHPRMNIALTRREVEDIAAYINTLAQ